jgi:hypothetical protein
MNHELHLVKTLGTFLAEGAVAVAYRMKEIEPFFYAYDEIVLDFEGVRNINSSFANALIAPLIRQHGQEALAKLRFHNCNPLVRTMIESALSLGIEQATEQGKCVSA